MYKYMCVYIVKVEEQNLEGWKEEMEGSKGSRIASLILRILTFILIFISLIINATNSKTFNKGAENETKFKFKDVYSYR